MIDEYQCIFQAQEEAEARDLGIGLLRTPDELSDGEKGNCGVLKILISIMFITNNYEYPNKDTFFKRIRY